MTAVCVLQPLSLIPKSSTSGLLIVDYPCTCLCLGFSQIILIFPFLLITLHFSQIGFTDDLTFTLNPPFTKRPFCIIALRHSNGKNFFIDLSFFISCRFCCPRTFFNLSFFLSFFFLPACCQSHNHCFIYLSR